MGTINPLQKHELYDYLVSATQRESELQRQLREKTCEMEPQFSRMMTAPEQAQFLAWLVTTMRATNVLEVGVFTGYSTLAMAQALPEGGRIVACDTSHDWTAVGQPFWQQAGVADRIDLRIAPALETMRTLAPEQFDLIFIDADKIHYDDYYEQALTLLRPGGVIVLDNVLWVGGEHVPAQANPATRAIYQVTQKIQADERVECSISPLSAGMLLVTKRCIL